MAKAHFYPLVKEKLPPTDSRLRPDQRHLENGEYEKANAEKLRLETRQRMVVPILHCSTFHESCIMITDWLHLYIVWVLPAPWDLACTWWTEFHHWMFDAFLPYLMSCMCSSAGKEDAGEWLETKMVPKGQRGWNIPLCWRLLGGKGAENMGWLQWHIW